MGGGIGILSAKQMGLSSGELIKVRVDMSLIETVVVMSRSGLHSPHDYEY